MAAGELEPVTVVGLPVSVARDTAVPASRRRMDMADEQRDEESVVLSYAPPSGESRMLRRARRARWFGLAWAAVGLLAGGCLCLDLVGQMLGMFCGGVAVISSAAGVCGRRPGRGAAAAGLTSGIVVLVFSTLVMVDEEGSLGWVFGSVALAGAVCLSLLIVRDVGYHERARRSICLSNVEAIGAAIAAYRAAGSSWPSDLAALVSAGLINAAKLRCPSSAAGRMHDYFYRPPAPGAMLYSIMACEFRGNHGSHGRAVLYVSGRAAFAVDEVDFQAELADPRNATFAAAYHKSGPIRGQCID